MCAGPRPARSPLTFAAHRFQSARAALRGRTALANRASCSARTNYRLRVTRFQTPGSSPVPPLRGLHCAASPRLPSPRPGQGRGAGTADRRCPGSPACYLAGVHLALQEAGTEHPVREGEAVEGAARLLVDDAHGRPLQSVGLRRCGERGPSCGDNPRGRGPQPHPAVQGTRVPS